MIITLSPAKSLDLTPSDGSTFSLPEMQTDTNKLVKTLKKLNVGDLQELMNISEALALENVSRYKNFRQRGPLPYAKRAIDIFIGDVYRGLNVADFNKEDYQFAQDHLRILSGLYGVLKPLDLIQPYRLEMGTKLQTETSKNLYEFWGDKITRKINVALSQSKSKVLINLASEEYFKAIKSNKIKGSILNVNFKEYRDGALKFFSFTAKIARGMMARYIIKNKLESKEDIKGFAQDNYAFSEEHSTDDTWIFVR